MVFFYFAEFLAMRYKIESIVSNGLLNSRTCSSQNRVKQKAQSDRTYQYELEKGMMPSLT